MSKKTTSGTQTSNERTYYLHQRNVKIYPVNVGTKMFIEVETNGKKKRFDKEVKISDCNDALAKTVNYYYKLFRDIEIAELAKKEKDKK